VVRLRRVEGAGLAAGAGGHPVRAAAHDRRLGNPFVYTCGRRPYGDGFLLGCGCGWATAEVGLNWERTESPWTSGPGLSRGLYFEDRLWSVWEVPGGIWPPASFCLTFYLTWIAPGIQQKIRLRPSRSNFIVAHPRLVWSFHLELPMKRKGTVLFGAREAWFADRLVPWPSSCSAGCCLPWPLRPC